VGHRGDGALGRPRLDATVWGARSALAFGCDSPADVDAAYAELSEAGHEGHLEPWEAPWGQRYAVVHDPDGNPVDLFAPLG